MSPSAKPSRPEGATPQPMPSLPEVHDAQEDLDRLFEEWRAEESHVDLSDLRVQDAVVFVLFWALFCVVFLQFYTRYVLNDSLGWTEEVARFLLIGVTFVGAVTASRKASHISVEAVLVFLPERVRHVVLLAVDLVVTVFCGTMAWYAYVLGARAPGYMVSLDLPKGWVYWGVAAALAGMTVHSTIHFIQRLRRRESDALHALALD